MKFAAACMALASLAFAQGSNSEEDNWMNGQPFMDSSGGGGSSTDLQGLQDQIDALQDQIDCALPIIDVYYVNDSTFTTTPSADGQNPILSKFCVPAGHTVEIMANVSGDGLSSTDFDLMVFE